MKNELISILVPVRNEELFIRGLLDSITNFLIPYRTEIDVWIIDGMSKDRTMLIVNQFQKKFPYIKIFHNTAVFQANGLNNVIKQLDCDWVMRLDAHTKYPSDYLFLCYQTAKLSGSDNCGGVINTLPGNNTYSANIVQSLTTHKFGIGNSGFRTEMKESEVDTVPFGFFKSSIFKKIGLFDERLVRAQDYEFNKRIVRAGGKIWLNPRINSSYFNQPSLLSFLKKQFLLEAPYNAYMWFLAPYSFAYRHAITGVFAVGVVGGGILSIFFNPIKYIYIGVMCLYILIATGSAFQQTIRYKKLLHFFTLPPSFFAYHFIHGLGVLKGLIKLLFGVAPVQKTKEPWRGYGKFRISIKK